MTLHFQDYLRHLRTNLNRFDEVIGRVDADTAVPTCPEWDAGELRDHMAGVLAFWRAQLGPHGLLEEPFFPVDLSEQATLPVLGLGDEVITMLSATGPDKPCWNWSGHDPSTRWVARRMAQESVIHRVDAESTAAALTPIDSELAADGIDELIDVFFDAPPDSVPDGAIVLKLVATDTDQVWNVGVTTEGVFHSADTATAQLSGTASDVLQVLWNRQSGARWTGDPTAPSRWRAVASL
jgi:uncharacterized protein (TIGR03083 family)